MKSSFSSFATAFLGAGALLGAAISASAADADGVGFFEAKIRPLFVERCYECHGDKKQKGGLRLDSKAAWEKGGDDGAVIKPGDPDGSPLIKAVRFVDKDLQMPPKHELPPDEVAALEKWVKLGAPDPRDGAGSVAASPVDFAAARKHWAFQPIAHPAPPAVAGNAWSQQPLDRFILARLRQAGLQPNAPAEKRALLRRATFDLTGLPPTPEEIQEYLSDPSPDAYDRLIERLLASSAYGERWGRRWLDVARYADTAGNGADYPVPAAIKYRDWVIGAFNADEPFDQQIREQIAGDILAGQGPPEQFAARVTATGFLAMSKRYGYKHPSDQQPLEFADVIDSVGRSVLGLSLGCARCHDHKFDPVSTADYYALYGILQSTKWAFPGADGFPHPADYPSLLPPEETARLEREQAAKIAELDAEIVRLKQERGEIDVVARAGGADLDFESQALGQPPAAPWVSAGANAVLAEAQSPFAHTNPPGTRGVRLGGAQPNDGIRYLFKELLRSTPGQKMYFTVDFRTAAPATTKGAYRLYVGRDETSPAVECSVTASEFAIRGDGKWIVVRKLEPGTWYTLQLTIDHPAKTYSAMVGTPGDMTAVENKPLAALWGGVLNTFLCDGNGHVSGLPPERDLDNVGVREYPFAVPGRGPPAAPAAPPADAKQRLAELKKQITAQAKARRMLALQDPYPEAYGVSEGAPVDAHIQIRGEQYRSGPVVPRRFLEVLGGDRVPGGAGSGRLELAGWLTRPGNPLTARVFVNRVWQWHFGHGLVSTASDFGLRGEPPTHPELLDWLTSEFIASGWSVKALHRLIMRSETYRLSSNDDAANLRIDPGNRWHWRFSRQPLDAESIRDAMLAISGRLDRTVPGPHPFPALETWSYTIHNPFHGAYDSDHRSVYLMVQRNERYPYLALFDAADPNVSVAERPMSTTPSQALYLMNSPFVHEQSEAFARRLLAAPGDERERIRLAFEMTQGEEPGEQALRASSAFLASYRTRLAGLGAPEDGQPMAAWAALGRVLLTSNGFLYVD